MRRCCMCVPHRPVQSTVTPARLSACCCAMPCALSGAPSAAAIAARTLSAYSRASARSAADGRYGGRMTTSRWLQNCKCV